MFLGIDLGTSSVKLLLMAENGSILDSISREYPVRYYNDNWAEQNADDWWNAVVEGIREIVKKNGKDAVRAISFSGQMHGSVLLDSAGEVLMPVILWCDQRTHEECDYLNKEIGVDVLLRETGNPALTGFTAPKLLWVRKNHPEIFEKIDKVMLPKDYIAYRLTGSYSTDMSDASGMILLDVKNRRWSEKMLEICGLDESQLPTLYESYEVVGTVQSSVADELGLRDDVQVSAGAGDQAAGAVGTGAVTMGLASIALGTSGVVFAPAAAYPTPDASLHTFADASGKWHQMGVVLSAASCLKWWTENIQKEADIPKLLEEASQCSPAARLVFLPYLIGERTPHNDPRAQGCFFGLNISHTRAEMTRALLEGVAFSLRDSYELMKKAGTTIDAAAVSGGGSKSHLWLQIISDALDIEVKVPETNEGPAYGAAILAAVGFGTFGSVEEACSELISYSKGLTPSNQSIYSKKFGVYQRLYSALKDEFVSLAAVK
ncbi:MAG: xylulokinase [Spirochaetota bacterium]